MSAIKPSERFATHGQRLSSRQSKKNGMIVAIEATTGKSFTHKSEYPPAVTHTFTVPGKHTVTATVTDSRGAVGTAKVDITVDTPTAPTCLTGPTCQTRPISPDPWHHFGVRIGV